METTLNSKGQVIGKDGNPIKIGDDIVTITNAKPQEEVDAAFQAEKAKHRTKLDGLNDQIKTLEAQTEKSASTQALLDQMKGDKSELESKLANAETEAAKKVGNQLSEAQQKADTATAALKAEQDAHLHTQLTNSLMGVAGNRFSNVGMDVIPHLLNEHKREPVLDDDGKPTGEHVDTYKVTYKDDKGEEVTKRLPADKALDAWANNFPHHVAANNRGGSGGGQYGNNSTINPWGKETWNVTGQHKLMAEQPEKAKAMKAAAGV